MLYEKFYKYLQFEKRYSPHTLVSYKKDLAQFQQFLLDAYELDTPKTVTRQIVRSWLMDLVQQEYAAKTISRKTAAVKSFYKFLLRESIINTLPTHKIITPKIRKRLPEFVPENQMMELLNDVKFSEDFTGYRDKLILELLYGTGIRLSELINLKKTNVNLLDKLIKVTGKGNKERLIPLNTELLNLIEKYLAKKEEEINNYSPYLVVNNAGDKMYPMFVYRIVRKYLDQITSIDKRSPHVLRHTFATHLLDKGADLNAIKELLGHSSLAATQVYTHNTLEKLKGIYQQAHPKA